MDKFILYIRYSFLSPNILLSASTIHRIKLFYIYLMKLYCFSSEYSQAKTNKLKKLSKLICMIIILPIFVKKFNTTIIFFNCYNWNIINNREIIKTILIGIFIVYLPSYLFRNWNMILLILIQQFFFLLQILNSNFL